MLLRKCTELFAICVGIYRTESRRTHLGGNIWSLYIYLLGFSSHKIGLDVLFNVFKIASRSIQTKALLSCNPSKFTLASSM